MKNILLLVLSCFTCTLLLAKQPSWITKRPVDQMSYIGIGLAKKNEPDYMQTAKKRALSDLISEIKVDVSSQSLLETMEVNSVLSSSLLSNIKVSATESITDYEVVDSWEDKKEYWVYYRLSKAAYELVLSQKRAKATQDGYSFWTQGLAAQASGDIVSAINMFIKGLEVIQPSINEELIIEHQGKTVNVGNELYSSLQKVFNGITLKASVNHVFMRAFQSLPDPIILSVTRDGVPLKNIKLNYSFVSGSGSFSKNNVTTNNGTVDMYIQSVTSKMSLQEVKVTMDPFAFREFKSPFYESCYRMFANNIPSATIRIEQEQSTSKVFIKNLGNIDPALATAVTNMLASNFFTVARLPEEATIFVLVESALKKGNLIKGDMYNSIEYFADVQIQLIDTETADVLLSCATNNRSLAKANESESLAKNNAIREVMRKVNRSFEKELQRMNRNN